MARDDIGSLSTHDQLETCSLNKKESNQRQVSDSCTSISTIPRVFSECHARVKGAALSSPQMDIWESREQLQLLFHNQLAGVLSCVVSEVMIISAFCHDAFHQSLLRLHIGLMW